MKIIAKHKRWMLWWVGLGTAPFLLATGGGIGMLLILVFLIPMCQMTALGAHPKARFYALWLLRWIPAIVIPQYISEAETTVCVTLFADILLSELLLFVIFGEFGRFRYTL